ncbi:hypothetical protein CPS_0493 [Colwellia psychrerythraea 34H]|uniref:ATPase AAA-type core domain-containing protein n=1 Tax=Colwellia psychrerythraea (strain 34H / ATCC BAA-681) TaxID=167879 RepID=Q489L3_COLP3|nr:hypothetical protein CPS_0493 [Colwellia psychrerythraea 34H]
MSFELNGTNHKFISNECNDLDNKYTFLVGENGSGKTECLVQIINSLNRYQLQHEQHEQHRDMLDKHLENRYKSSLVDFKIKSNLVFEKKDEKISISFEKTDAPREIIGFDGKKINLNQNSFRYIYNFKTSATVCNKADYDKESSIIAISESPYNKFPILQSDSYFNYYNIGVNTEEKNEYLNHQSDDYVHPKVKQLTMSICGSLSEHHKTNFSHLFRMLGFSEKIKFTLKIKDSFKYLNNNSKELAERVVSNRYRDTRFSSVGKNTEKEIESKKNQDKTEIIKAIDGLHKLEPNLFTIESNQYHDSMNRELDFDIDFNSYTLMTGYVKTLIEYDVLFVSNIYFYNLKFEKQSIDSSRLSSGQLCVLNLIFGISSKILNNSLILIDEPEISLHPHWQSNIISVIHNSFKNYTACHFIIATHSPHIISNVIKNNSSLVLMENSENNNLANDIINTEYGCQGWTVEEILHDIMGMSDTRTDEYHQRIKEFEVAIEQDNYLLAKASFTELDNLLHPNNHLRKLLKLDLVSVKSEVE